MSARRKLLARTLLPATRQIGAAMLLAVGLLATCSAQAAKPDKPDKPDKVEKPDKVADKPDKVPKAERSAQPERAPAAAPNSGKKAFRTEKSSGRSTPTSGAPAAEPPGRSATNAGSGYDAFSLIADRNIFNPNRVARVRESPPEPPRVETVALVGVLQSDGGVVAFFHSEDRHLQQIAREGETIGGLTVMQISPGGVQLMQDGEAIHLRVNQQMRRVAGGAWKALPREVARTEVARAADGTPLPAIPPGASEVLRRLMEQRQKQLKQ